MVDSYYSALLYTATRFTCKIDAQRPNSKNTSRSFQVE